MFKKNHKFFFLMLMSLWALSKPVAKKNYCIKNQNRSSSRENYRKKNCSPVFCSSNNYFAQNFCFFFLCFCLLTLPLSN